MKLHTRVWGDGPPVICVHGVTAHAERFRRLAEERLRDRRVLAVDLRGHGRSGWEPPWNLETHVSDLAETAAAHGIERATWIGVSFGGRLVAELALRDPWRFSTMVLLDPALELPADYALEAAEDEQTVHTFRTRDEAVEARIGRGGLVSTPREFLEEDMDQHLDTTLDGRLVGRYSRPAAIAAWGEMARPAAPPADVPTLFVVGSESQLDNDAHRERYRVALGDRLAEVELPAGHNVLWDDFGGTAAAISRFA